ncbi:MAG: hypothetical protein ACXQTG_02545 [Methanoculleaceae archaeon]
MPERSREGERYIWLAVPLLAFCGIAIELTVPGLQIPVGMGGLGCIAGSVLLAILSMKNPRKDIVSLFVPMFAVIIFLLPGSSDTGITMQILFAATLAAVAYRLEVRFTHGQDR